MIGDSIDIDAIADEYAFLGHVEGCYLIQQKLYKLCALC